MKRFVIAFALALLCSCGAEPAYKNAGLPAEKRAGDLLKRMTLDEKLGQLICPYGWPMYERLPDGDVSFTETYREFIDESHGGMLWGFFRADPWTRKTLENGLCPELAVKAYNAVQHYAVDSTRLGIPVLLCEEAPHGHMAIGTTVFPTGIGLVSSWDEDLMEDVGRAVSEELRAVGAGIAYGPVIDLAREMRWSRVEETYGEDPCLTSTLAGGVVRGMSPAKNGWDRGVVPTLKHFVAYGAPQGGHNGYVSVIGERDMRENVLPVFKHCIDEGALSLMTSYNSIDGVPCTANKDILQGTVRGDWGFEGIIVSDLIAIDGLCGTHHVARDNSEAAELALRAGVDVDLGANCYPLLKERVKKGLVSEKLIDRAVRRVLEMKFRLGLFDNPYVEAQGVEAVRSDSHCETALRAAREGTVLLENNGILPLSKDLKVAVVGPNADRMYNQLGDYTAPQPEDNVTTPLEGIKAKIGPENVRYAHGCGIRDLKYQNIDDAVRAARNSDVVVAFVGGSSARDFGTKYSDTGAALADGDALSDMECGEGYDRASLELMGLQQQLLEALKATGKPLVVVYIEGRPLDKRWAKENADALLTQFYPGQAGGEAIADVIFGDYNPAGRLPVSVPYSVSQLPVHYNQPFPPTNNYIDCPSDPLYAFGYGLSYTSFSYEDIHCDIPEGSSCPVEVRVCVRNDGPVDGDEVVQLYVTDLVASTVRPRKLLKAFKRVHIARGETVELIFSLGEDAFTLYDTGMNKVLESGDFLIGVGPSSDNVLLETLVSL